MSRSGYIDDGDCDDVLAMGRWQGQVASAIRGKRGQAALRELAAAMDAMPVKALAAESLVTADGEFCTLGVLGQARGIDMAPIDPEDWDAVAKAFNLAPAMVREIVYENDEGISTYDWVDVEICGPVRPYHPEWGRHHVSVRVDVAAEVVARKRWNRMRKWVADHLASATGARHG
ncbi:hypothetical protein [Variovorax sp.]|jgi:hypothetical protein|uniref:hypothetical protein n=1 Tax=Variovorax sp. TaxID=1871043 RepID=UPI0040378CD3